MDQVTIINRQKERTSTRTKRTVSKSDVQHNIGQQLRTEISTFDTKHIRIKSAKNIK